MAAIEDQLREVRAQISAVQGKKARAQVEHDNALTRKEDARNMLEQEFGVTTTDDAKRVLIDLQSELDTAVLTVTTKLEEAGA